MHNAIDRNEYILSTWKTIFRLPTFISLTWMLYVSFSKLVIFIEWIMADINQQKLTHFWLISGLYTSLYRCPVYHLPFLVLLCAKQI